MYEAAQRVGYVDALMIDGDPEPGGRLAEQVVVAP
jgi:hypothetical protein